MKKFGIALRHWIYFIGLVTSLYAVIKLVGLSKLPEQFNLTLEAETKPLKTIYLWSPHSAPSDGFAEEKEKDSLAFFKTTVIHPQKPPPCPVTCRYSTKPKFLPTADAVVFLRFDLVFYPNRTLLEPARRPLQPDERPREQLYIFFSMEAPRKHFEMLVKDNPIPKRFFNHTMSYRWDSTIHLPYYKVVKVPLGRRNYLPDMSRKTKFAVWMVSNCYAQSQRHKLVQKLRSYVHVDIYGECSKVYSPCGSASDEKCYQSLGKTHKFYLSFENSLCVDYVTEKFFYALNSDMIPIVYGQANYSLLAPSKSFIDVRDFPTIRDLALYLMRLDENETEYLEFFRWKKNWEVSAISGWEDPLCTLCQKITSEELLKKPSVIQDLGSWWMTAKDGLSPACNEPPLFI